MNALKAKIANDFSKASLNYDEHSFLQKKVCSKLFDLCVNDFNGKPILDLGCGTGQLNELLNANNLINNVLSLDISHGMCKLAKNKMSSMGVIQADIEDLPFKKNFFDNIFSSLALQWCDLQSSIYQINRALKNNGFFGIATLGCDTLKELKISSNNLKYPVNMLEFVKTGDLKECLENNLIKDFKIFEQTYKLAYNDIYELLASIKNIGACYKPQGYTNYLGKKYFTNLDSNYRKKFGQGGRLYASWHVVYIMGYKKK